MLGRLDLPAYRTVSLIILASVALACLYNAVLGRWIDALTLGALATVGAVFLAVPNRLPSLFTLLFVVGGLINTLGYMFDWWQNPVWFDEAVHAYTSFAIIAAIGWFLFCETRMNAAGRSAAFTVAVTGVGLLLGVLWEAFEWLIGIIGSPRDTMIDLVMDVVGAIAAGLFCAWVARERLK